MSTKKGKLPPVKSSNLVERMVELRMPELAVIATERPIERWDEATQQIVNEVLLMDGIVLRGGRDQIPIVDSHNDKTVRNIFGSIRGLKVSNGELFGKPDFASDDESQTIARRLAEGHITDFSITAQPLETLFVKRGDSFTTPRGEVIEGPALIHTRWQPHNASICATGADEYSTVRRSYTDLQRKVTRMDEALLAQLTAAGLPDGMTDPNQVLAWCVAKLVPAESEAEDAPMVEAMAEPPVDPATEQKPVENMDALKNPVECQVGRSVDATEQIKRALEVDQKRRKEIQAACKLANIERAFADELCDGHVPLSEARKRIIERMATTPLGSSVGADVRVTQSGDDKFVAAAKDGIVARMSGRTSIKRSLYVSGDKPAEGHEDFKSLNLIRMATLFAERAGLPVNRMNNPEIARAVLRMSTLQGYFDVAQRYRIERADFNAYHTTGSFANLMLDAANKTLLAGYEEAPFTWNMWARQANSVDDFKNINRIRFSEAPNPEEVPEGKDYPEKAMADSKESYKVSKFGESFSVSWETIVNDDLDALSRIPAMHGNAMRRFQNKKIYEVLINNPTMGDGYTLFSSSHVSGDNTASAAAPSVTTLNAAFVKMMTQKGTNKPDGTAADAVLNIVPRYLIVPVNYSATALELVASTSYVLANSNQGVKNIYGPGGDRPLTVVVEPVLDAASTTNWFLAADNAQVDTVEISFLSGEESPVVESEYNIRNDTYYNKIRQTFGVKAIDWRGLFRNGS